jgi:hypothetical protein
MAANLNKNPETSKCFGIFFIKKYKKEGVLSFLSLNHDFEQMLELVHASLNHDLDPILNINTLAGIVDTLAIQVIPSVIVIRSL